MGTQLQESNFTWGASMKYWICTILGYVLIVAPAAAIINLALEQAGVRLVTILIINALFGVYLLDKANK